MNTDLPLFVHFFTLALALCFASLLLLLLVDNLLQDKVLLARGYDGFS